MRAFDYQKRTRLVFGEGAHARAGEIAAQYAESVMLVYGGQSAVKSGLHGRVLASLKAAGLRVCEFGGVRANPHIGPVYAAVAQARENGVQLVLALGGGSVIDTAKAIAAGACHNGDVWDLYTGAAPAGRALAVGSVLTIPAAGSESSSSSVMTEPDTMERLSLNGDFLVPAFAILDPTLCLTLPAAQMRAGVCDIMAHVFERYFTGTPDTAYTDQLCEATLRSVMDSARALVRNLADVKAWGELMLAGNLAHNGVLGLGRESDWASHDIEHELSARYDIAHGAGLAIVFPAWMRYVYRRRPTPFAQLAVRVFGVGTPLADLEAVALEGIGRFEEFLHLLGLPTTFAGAGLPTGELAEMAAHVCRGGPLGHFVRLEAADVEAIYRLGAG